MTPDSSENNDEKVNEAIRELIDGDTGSWMVIAGKSDDTVVSHIHPSGNDVIDGVPIHPPYSAFAAHVMREMAKSHDMSHEDALEIAYATLQKEYEINDD